MSLNDFIATNDTPGELTPETFRRGMLAVLYHGLTNEQALALDQRTFGVSYTDVTGNRIPPWEIKDAADTP